MEDQNFRTVRKVHYLFTQESKLDKTSGNHTWKIINPY